VISRLSVSKMKKLKVNNDLLGILNKINSESKTIEQWRENESSDMYQTSNYCGGFDSIENEFTFSYYDEKSTEYWFQLSLDNIDKLISGQITEIEMRLADK